MSRVNLSPTLDQTFEIRVGERGEYNFKRVLRESRQLQAEGEIEQACNLRFAAVQQLQELFGDEEMQLEWNDENTRAALELIYLSGIDHFLISDFEISSALFELTLDLDPEDHLEASNLLAYDYLAMEEYELFDEVINDISDKYASRTLLLLWSGFLREGSLSVGELHSLRSRFAPYYAEFSASEHPIDEIYLNDIESERPSHRAQARELWLQTEHLWSRNSNFIEALRGA